MNIKKIIIILLTIVSINFNLIANNTVERREDLKPQMVHKISHKWFIKYVLVEENCCQMD